MRDLLLALPHVESLGLHTTGPGQFAVTLTVASGPLGLLGRGRRRRVQAGATEIVRRCCALGTYGRVIVR